MDWLQAVKVGAALVALILVLIALRKLRRF